MLEVRALLVSTYDLGHQPFGLASPAAWLRRAGCEVTCTDLSKERLNEETASRADLVAFHLPMHTATRLAGPVIRKVRALNPSARLCTFGLYSPLNREWLQSLGVDHVLGGEFEEQLVAVARGETASQSSDVGHLPRLVFVVPDRSGLPPLMRYATLQVGDGSTRLAGYTEASRGCKHLCRHCPVVPVYDGQFRVVPPETVLADVRSQVEAGAGHITFGDPDFFNGPRHALSVVEGLHDQHPDVTYDVTIKIEHLLRHREMLPRLRQTGCVFVTSAVESLDDRVLALLEKGHTRADFLEAVEICEEAGVTLVPTFVAFHPWLTLEGYCDLLDSIATLDLVDRVAPIQLAIRLLVPKASRLLELPELQSSLGPFDAKTLAYPWSHPNPQVDRLHRDVTDIVGSRLTADRRGVFAEISALAHERAGVPAPSKPPLGRRVPGPYFNEPWYCCAEPNPEQLRVV